MKRKPLWVRILLFILIIILVTGLPLAVMLWNGFGEAADLYAETEANRRINYTLHEALNRHLVERGSTYDDFALLRFDAEQRISSVTVNSVKLNLLATELTTLLIDELIKMEYGSFAVPLGNAMGSRFFSGRGPKIPLRVVPLGSVTSELRSDFRSAGINQSLHRICIDFFVCVSLLTPYYTTSQNIRLTIVVAETVIVGTVPGIIWGSNPPSNGEG